MAKVPEILVVDQDPKARYEVKQLTKHAQLSIVGEAAFGTDAISMASDVKPDVIICGMSSPPERSLQTIEALLDVLPETPIVTYGWRDDSETVRLAMIAGARDYFAMPANAEKVLESVRSVLESEERKRLRLTGQTKALGPKGLVITVFGVKGGVGKSTIATNLGVALATELAQSVVLVDGDNNFGDAAAMLDLKPQRNIMDLLREADAVERGNVTDYLTQHSSGLWVLAAPRECLQWRSVTPERFRKVVTVLARRFDVVLIDTAGALGDLSLSALEEANMVLWVTSSDFSSINNSLQALETLEQLSYPDSRIRLMLNVTSADDGVRPAKIEEVLGRQFFWLVPYDREIRLGTQTGKPAVSAHRNSRGAQSIVQLAQALMGVSVATVNPKPTSLRNRLFSRNGSEGERSVPVRGEAIGNAEAK